MPFCSQCGVRVDDHVAFCPLCAMPIQKCNGPNGMVDQRYPDAVFKVTLTNRQKRFLAWQVISVLLLIAFLAVMATNLLHMGNLSWAGYPMAAIGVGWVLSTLILFFIKSPTIIISGFFLVVTGFLVLIDVFDGSLDWFLVLGLPLAGMATLFLLFTYLCIVFSRGSISLFLSLFLAVIIILCIGLDLLISGYLVKVSLSWSLIVTISLFPISLLLCWYYFYLRRNINIKKIFHY